MRPLPVPCFDDLFVIGHWLQISHQATLATASFLTDGAACRIYAGYWPKVAGFV